ncbi:MAG: ABC transporter ATP-binding protein [Anaerolineales bacterium]|nr:ABC transporter ATP-binding protein [Anaerolineales bacterium]
MSDPYIQVADLRKEFRMGQMIVTALDEVDLAIQENTFTVVMGPSGSGKSTLLYLLGGLDRPTQGQIRVGGQSIETLDENELAVYRRQKVGFIFQSFNLISSMTALQNVAFPMRFARIGRRQRQQRAAELLHRVGLEDRAHHRPGELSGGQQQRVAIARSLVNEPRLILADEPTGNLDTASGASIMQLLSELHRSGQTVVVVSHDPRMTHFATQALYLLDGRIVSQEAYEKASTLALESATQPPAPTTQAGDSPPAPTS